jgi:hypothetical protein
MPIEYNFIDSGRGILLAGQAVVEGRELLAIKQSFADEPKRMKGVSYWLVDFSEVNELRMSGDELSRLVEIDRQLASSLPHSMVAVAAPADSVYGFARMRQIKMESVDWATSVFRDISDAKLWIRSGLFVPPDVRTESSVNAQNL